MNRKVSQRRQAGRKDASAQRATPGPTDDSQAMSPVPSSARRKPIEYADASPEVRAVYDDIMATRKVDWVNNFWKVLAHHPPTLRRIWSNVKEVMGPGALDPLTKELLYVAVSASNGCRYCIASHGAAARKQGMTQAQYSELLAIVGLANETNRLVTALDVEVDPQFL
jgi:AhpD family alkylhydroperoxidase